MAFAVKQPKNNKQYERGELLIIAKNAGKLSLSEITKKINDEFGNNRTEVAIEAKANQQGFPLGLIK